MVFNSKKITTCFGQERPSSGYYNFAQRVLYICLYCEVMLRSHHRYALQSIYIVGSLMGNDWIGRCGPWTWREFLQDPRSIRIHFKIT